MTVHLKKLFMLILLCSAMITTHAKDNPLQVPSVEFYGGFAPKYRGHFTRENFQEFKTKLASENRNEMFHYDGLLEDFLQHVRTVLGNDDITPAYIVQNMKVGGAPKGMVEGGNSTYEMCYWDTQYNQIWGSSRYPRPGEDFIWIDGVCVASLFCFNFTKPVERKQLQPENEGIGYERVDGNTSIIRTSYPGVTIINNNNNNNNNNPGSGWGNAGPSINVTPRRSRGDYYGDDGYDDSYYSRRRAPRVTWAEGVSAVSGAVRDVAWGISSLKNAFNPEPQTYNIRMLGTTNWGYKNYFKHNWQTTYNTGSNPWHGATNLASTGNFQSGWYDNGTGQVFGGGNPYSNDASVNIGSGYVGSGSGNGYYGVYSNGYKGSY